MLFLYALLSLSLYVQLKSLLFSCFLEQREHFHEPRPRGSDRGPVLYLERGLSHRHVRRPLRPGPSLGPCQGHKGQLPGGPKGVLQGRSRRQQYLRKQRPGIAQQPGKKTIWNLFCKKMEDFQYFRRNFDHSKVMLF